MTHRFAALQVQRSQSAWKNLQRLSWLLSWRDARHLQLGLQLYILLLRLALRSTWRRIAIVREVEGLNLSLSLWLGSRRLEWLLFLIFHILSLRLRTRLLWSTSTWRHELH